MTELSFLIEILKYTGFPALIFIIFYIYHKSQAEILLQIIKNIENRDEKLNEYLQQQSEILQYLSGTLSRIEYKIDINYPCPMIKKEVNK